MTTYKVKVVGLGIIWRGTDPRKAQARRDLCIPEAQARVISIPQSR